MRKVIILALMAVLPLACGNKLTDNNNGVSVAVFPGWATVNLDTTMLFTATVYGTSDQRVTWELGGDSTCGALSQTGLYRAPQLEPVNGDSIRISAHSVADLSAIGNAWIFLQDPTAFYVSTTGHDDSLGKGSMSHPFRTITHALNLARNANHSRVQMIKIAAGTYDVQNLESFPLSPRSGLTLRGAGSDSTFIVGPGGSIPPSNCVITIDGIYEITVDSLNISTSNSNGIGIMVRGFINDISISRNQISGCKIGLFADSTTSFWIQDNRITGDSIGISIDASSGPYIRGNIISDCYTYGIEILDHGQPNLGSNDSTSAGNNTIQNCGDQNYHWLIYNLSPNSIWAIGNTWQTPVLNYNDQYIYDDEESGGSSGPVWLRTP